VLYMNLPLQSFCV